MASSSPSLKCKLSCLLDQQQQRQYSFSGDQMKIQKVPPYLRERSEFNQYYFPKLISIGPIHHPKGEEYKEKWATMYLQYKLKGQQQQQEEEEEAEKLLDSIRSEIQALKACYTEDVIQGLDDDELAWILFLDGCATLHVMDKVGPKDPSNLQAPYIIAQQDLLLLENQLPCQVLRILSKNDDSSLKNLTNNFLIKTLHIVPRQSQLHNVFENDHPHPAHLLDLLIKSISFGKEKGGPQKHGCLPCGGKTNETKKTHRNIQELITAGIKIRKEENAENITSISLSRGGGPCCGGKLRIPPLTIDDFTAQTFMNMMACEMCPDSRSEYKISAYVSFLNSLIDYPEDVKVLRKAGVVRNLLGSDGEVAQIFNTASTDLVLDTGIYSEVEQQIEHLYEQKLRVWVSEFRKKYFGTPWALIGLIAFILGFVATILTLLKEFRPKKGSP